MMKCRNAETGNEREESEPRYLGCYFIDVVLARANVPNGEADDGHAHVPQIRGRCRFHLGRTRIQTLAELLKAQIAENGA